MDQEIPSFGSEYVNGGAEYYTQVVKRNKALHFIMKDLTKDNFTAQGNERVNPVWNDRIRATDKRDFYRQQAEKLTNENKQENSVC